MVGQVVKFNVIPRLRLADTGKFSVVPGLSGQGHPLAGDRAAFPRHRSARVALKACAWLTTSLENWGVNRGKPRDGDGSSSRAN
ncbi:hypothetical protein BDN71DRAFT_1445978 [Pleurotus eryngii]|uniref:Uncharacterized protein n=1 Tax=Pleurotus eryngii TaxID=5323 RepID=A0A9P6A3T8_PLEER|nr:hypothetical protein BDN71DRAFT_1445978 [Pleurotus eryngii]